MVLDLEKLQSLEKKYQDDPITSNTLSDLISIVLSSKLDSIDLCKTIQYKTLLKMGIIKEDNDPQQLNS